MDSQPEVPQITETALELIIKDEPISLSMFDNPSIYIPVTGLLIASLTSLAVKLLKIKESNY